MRDKIEATLLFFYVIGIPLSYGFFGAYLSSSDPAVAGFVWIFLAPVIALAWPAAFAVWGGILLAGLVL